MAKLTPRQLKIAAYKFWVWREEKRERLKEARSEWTKDNLSTVWNKGQHNPGKQGALALRAVDTMMASPIGQRELLRDTRSFYE
jgi:hypothetical protein